MTEQEKKEVDDLRDMANAALLLDSEIETRIARALLNILTGARDQPLPLFTPIQTGEEHCTLDIGQTKHIVMERLVDYMAPFLQEIVKKEMTKMLDTVANHVNPVTNNRANEMINVIQSVKSRL